MVHIIHSPEDIIHSPEAAERRSKELAKHFGYEMDPIEEVARKLCFSAGHDPNAKDAEGRKLWLRYVEKGQEGETVSSFEIRRGRV